LKLSHRFLTACLMAALVAPATARAQSGDEGPRGLSRLLPGVGRQQPSTDPFEAAGRGPEVNPPVAGAQPPAPMVATLPPPAGGAVPGAGSDVQRLPSAPPPAPMGMPGAAPGMAALPGMPPAGTDAQPGNPAQRQASDQLLVQARKALAVGDVRRAAQLNEQAKAIGYRYSFQDDQPSKVQASIEKMAQLQQQQQAGNAHTETYRRQYSNLLLEQADALLRWGDIDEAERLALDAQKLNLRYSPFENSPERVLAQVAGARQTGGARFVQGQMGGQPSNSSLQLAGGMPGAAGAPGAPAGPQGMVDAKSRVMELVARARIALSQNNIAQAEQLASQAAAMNVPDSAFAPNEDRPSFVLLDVRKVRLAGGGGDQQPANQALYQGIGPAPAQYAQGEGPLGIAPAVPPTQPMVGPQAAPQPAQPGENRPMTQAMQIAQQGEEALQKGDPNRARELFKQALGMQHELDAATRQLVMGRLQYLGEPAVPLNEAAMQQAALRRQIGARLADAERRARNLQQGYPLQSLQLLEQARAEIERSNLDEASKQDLMRRADGAIASMRQYIEENKARIELDERNQAVLEERERERLQKVEIEQKLAYLVDEFNKLMDQQRFAEAEVVAKRAAELAPNEPIVKQLKWNARFVRNFNAQMDIRDAKEQGFVLAMESVDKASEPFDDRSPIVFSHDWKELTARRRALGSMTKRRNEKELEIEQKLRTPVSLRFTDTPLSEVMEYLARVANVNLHLDQRGLSEEGINPNTPVTINLMGDIQLKSALNLILQPLQLSYVIKDEVLKITSQHARDGEVVTLTYNVADLVIPIPNFVPSVNMGMTSAINEAYRQAGRMGGLPAAPMVAAASPTGGTTNAVIDPAVMAQMGTAPMAGFGGPPTPPVAPGPGGLGGGAEPDFDSLIQLITTTVKPDSWQEHGGPGSVAPFETNLSLVITQTQEVHEQIADLLDQLRRLQDLQVTIEVRFITLNDNFFERIGVDFDFDIDDDIDRPFQVFGRPDLGPSTSYSPANNLAVGSGNPARDVQDRDHGPSVTVGMSQPGVFSADMDIPVAQGSFPLATPQFGGFQPGAGATVGFAILSEIEAFFFIEASQGDRRSNVLQAPKVTLFNGQSAIVSDTSQTPFVISVVPVVGDFAAAQQPVIVVLNEGTFLNVQAVVSDDRRFVRLTVVPFFSSIGEVNTFTFTGEETTTIGSSQTADDRTLPVQDRPQSISRSGTTVQLPTFSFVTVSTTVSVPDGGTVLLGGIKRLSEGRNEFGVPILNKVPYINRLFRNVGIGRETQSLMMMVTPRIIIKEEEEQLLGITPAP